MTDTTNISNPTTLSDYDWLEFVAFVWKVEREGFTYAAENYGPEFEDEGLHAVAEDLGKLRAFYREHAVKVDTRVAAVGGEKACDLHNDHVREARQRKEDARLFGIRCTDGYVITLDSEENRDANAAHMKANADKGWREPAVLLRRDVPGGEWTEERDA